MNNEELAAQVSALDLKPGTAVVLRLTQDTPADVARKMGQELRKHVPFGTQIFVLPNGQEIETIDEALMRELGWVRWEKVEPLIGCAELLADNLRRDAENVSDDMEAAGMERHADNIDALVRQVKGTQPELPL